MTENAAITFTTLFTIMGGVATVFLLTRYFARRLRSQELIRALETGNELPPERQRHGFESDLRAGIVLVAFAIGLALFVRDVDRESASMAFIPLFLGVGFLVNAFVVRRLALPETASAEPGTPGDREE